MPLIDFRGAAVAYDGEQVLAPLTVSLSEQRIGIIGSNGSGKSTTVRLINGLIEPTSGQVLYDGLTPDKHGRDIRKRVGFVFSDAESQIVMPRVSDDVAFSLRRFKLPREEVKRRVADALERFDLADRAENSPHTLSGGEKQMLALASVLVIEPDTIIADEPTTLLDLRNRRRIMRELMSLDQQLIVVTHDLEMLRGFDRVLVIDDGALAYDGTPDDAIAFYTDLMDAKP
ncbi:Biotin transport ATP-binding protein BioM [Corynebacterium afermentans subsp. afermentans]|uniref:Biotin transport system ATP-binding protein n=1 Tax=Corynebacterium afermentans TaxID=38286 RepID=A0A9X8R1A6_9CORY|nr:ABC transporter ATP-binding protein [Corynebacterium afermentans]OAA17800.1 cobalt ABC transporter ATP-binding protein [Corynebacterium afermentans subsp. afermentans]WJY56953.1 Biotin transport ATP-binding protein BioM [Corynebacterium afermentans subsp. afermentans]SIQ00619.1 biotin transport system ATP-binding protein [Corynebacterium afermentans]